MIRQILRVPGLRRLWHRFPIGPLATRARYDIWPRAPYGYGVFRAAALAKQVGISSINVIEFGVAGGRGLLALETISASVGAHFGIRIDVTGFDSGTGLPKPTDYRDLPYLWGEGFYRMDAARLHQRLSRARLVLGDVATTAPSFLASTLSGPIGFVSFDLDYYSSTRDGLRILLGTPETRLPRVFLYFDDLIWPEDACYSEYTGEYLAIHEFNEAHPTKKISKIPYLTWMRPFPAAWQEQMYVLHDFEHPRYATNTTSSERRRQMPL
jgi:hypothetical protein